MGQGSAETVKEIEETRDRLDSELRELEDRLPRPAVWTKRLAGMAVGGGVAGTAFWFALRRVRNRRKKKEMRARAPVQTVVQVLPDDWVRRLSEATRDGRWKPWAAGVGGVWVLFRLAELRQIRKMNRALLARR